MIATASCHPRGRRGNQFATKPHKRPINHLDRRRKVVDLLRHDFPEGVDPSSVSQAKLNSVAKKLDGRPGKTLDFQTLIERYHPVSALSS